MYHNLTDKQLSVLRWFVERFKNDELEDTFMIGRSPYSQRITINEYEGRTPDCVTYGRLNALVFDGEFIMHKNSKGAEIFTVTRKAYEIAAFDFDNPQPDPLRTFIKEAHVLMLESFNREELTQVCFGLGINADWIFSDKRDWPFELLLYLYRNNRLDELPSVLQKERPNVDWPEYP